MSIESKYAYRFGFLKSEEWETLRLLCIATDEGKCVVCGKYNESNDAHHLFYRTHWKNTKVEDLMTLCRKCHKDVHDLGADILARELWENYKCFLKSKMGKHFCRICKNVSAGELIPVPVTGNTPPMACRLCVDIFLRELKEVGSPWKAYENAKRLAENFNDRKFKADALRNFVNLGIQKHSERNEFARAVIRAGWLIRGHLKRNV